MSMMACCVLQLSGCGKLYIFHLIHDSWLVKRTVGALPRGRIFSLFSYFYCTFAKFAIFFGFAPWKLLFLVASGLCCRCSSLNSSILKYRSNTVTKFFGSVILVPICACCRCGQLSVAAWSRICPCTGTM